MDYLSIVAARFAEHQLGLYLLIGGLAACILRCYHRFGGGTYGRGLFAYFIGSHVGTFLLCSGILLLAPSEHTDGLIPLFAVPVWLFGWAPFGLLGLFASEYAFRRRSTVVLGCGMHGGLNEGSPCRYDWGSRDGLTVQKLSYSCCVLWLFASSFVLQAQFANHHSPVSMGKTLFDVLVVLFVAMFSVGSLLVYKAKTQADLIKRAVVLVVPALFALMFLMCLPNMGGPSL